MGKSPNLDISATIHAPAGVILSAFFEPDALSAWWQVAHALAVPRTLGPYAVEWAPTEFHDDKLGRLGGVFRGTVMHFDPGEGFFIADAYWLPPDGDPIGPMAMEVRCTAGSDGGTMVRVTQTGFEEGERWRRYYEVIEYGWERALASMKLLLEK
jgi:uncharacterized protein YndB with AHSA1/START domain